MKNIKQYSLIPNLIQNSSFGGQLLEGKRKSARPISIKMPMHIAIKSDQMIFSRKIKQHRENLQRIANRFNIKIIQLQFNGNHVHIVARFFHRESYFRFIRAFTGLTAALIGAKGLFPLRPYTRFVQWGRDIRKMSDYIRLNEFESDGIVRTNGRIVLAQMDWGP